MLIFFLIFRCMVQISKISLKYGTIERCRIHDLLRELAIDKAEEENFLQVNPQQKDGYHHHHHHHHNLRRAAHFQTDVHKFCNNTNLRSLLIFDVRIASPIKFRLLKVLELKGISSMKDLPHEITNMVHLRYLGLSRTGICSLPKNIDHLQKLQTLDIREAHVTKVPVSLWEITTLRHVHSSWNRPINGPPRRSQLEHILTLKYIKVMAWKKGLPYMKNIRKLGIRNTDNQESTPTAELLRNLEHLCSLNVEWQVLPEEIVDMRPFRSYYNIRNLGLRGEWPRSMSFEAAMIAVHVTKLILYHTRFEKDPMSELGKLQSLKELELGRHAVTCKKMACLAGGFPQLQRLSVTENESLEEWHVEEGSFPSLKYLWIVACWRLRMIPELQHVTSLQIFEVSVMPHDFKLRFASPDGEDWHKIKNIPQVLYIF
jgi:Leucine-rich repeat (LRR) protein